MSRKLTITDIIETSKLVHNNKFDYSKAVYLGAKVKMCIICPIHGEFWQEPYSHKTGLGCQLCANGVIANKLTYDKDTFVAKADIIHNKFYDYSKSMYVKGDVKIEILCPVHGIFTQIPESHLQGAGCMQCAIEKRAENKTSNTQAFIEKAKSIHGDKYDYSKFIYTKAVTKSTIICPEHGEFLQTPNGHLSGRGCRTCSVSMAGFRRSMFIKKHEGMPTYLYVIETTSNNEQFIKVGITGRNTMRGRFYEMKHYKFITRLQLENTPDVTWDLEKHLHRKLKEYNYTPKIKFGGCTECFTFEALNHINALLLTNPIIKINESIPYI